MPRLARVDVANNIYHVINRSTGRLQIFNKASDYQDFTDLLLEAKDITDMRILAYTIMPNHWHLVLYPRMDGDLGTFMHRLTNAHTRQVHTKTKTIGYGPLYQGRYKSFLVDTDEYYLTLLKYVERNPVRAKLAQTCEAWQWGSAQLRKIESSPLLSQSPVPAT
jgi:putative transposase